ncbi:MAG: glutamate 5-kinase [Alphaproteobacteria bacterium]|nr:glutamate 5-kinase [Alphaproteobacteria bacterium]
MVTVSRTDTPTPPSPASGGGKKAALAKAKRVVVKIGSSLLVEGASGALRRAWLAALAEDVARLQQRGQEVVIVSSGAIALGRRALGLPPGALRLEEKQAAASAGQIRLAHAYQDALAKFGIGAAQVLLTGDDTESRRRYLNAKSTLMTLLGLQAVPVINENDTVATEEIRYGDNDRLAARVAQMVSADCLVLLSDIDGLYDADPSTQPAAKLIPEVREITAAIEAMAGATKSADMGTGGMITKLAAAKIAMNAGCAMALADGRKEGPLAAIEAGSRCTWFLPNASPRTARKNWIAAGLKPSGTLVLDAGAVGAMARGKSLLPAGVKAVKGDFQRGDAVILAAPDGTEIGRGLSAYSAADARKIIGHKSGEIEGLLGYRGRDEMVHRDDLVITAELVAPEVGG